MTLTTEATAARDAELAEQAEADEAARQQMCDDAAAAVQAVLVRADGTLLTLAASGLEQVHVDAENVLTVWSDGPVSLAAQREGGWVVAVVTKVDGQWQRGPVVASLADLGAVLGGGA